MEALLILLVLGIILAPIIIISMLSGIRGEVDRIGIGQQELKQQLRKLNAEREIRRTQKEAVADSDQPSRKAGKSPAPEGKPPVPLAKSTSEPEVDSPETKQDSVTPLPEIPVAKPALAALSKVSEKPEGEPESATEPKDEVGGGVSDGISNFQETVQEVLTKIWNWILVGEEHRSKKMTAEYAIASVWLLRVGIVAVVTGIGFFLKLSIQRGWIGEEMRTAMCFVTGAGMIALGMRMLGKRYHVIGQGFLGGGVAVLYFSAYAASVMYGLVPDWVGFVLMALVTVTAGVIAVRADSMTVAVLGIAGGYVSPFFFTGSAVSLPVLYAYILILSLGVLGLAQQRRWRFLHYLAFIFTYTAFFYSRRGYAPDEHFGVTITFLSLFFVVHSAVVYIYHLSRRHETTTLDIFHLIANAAVYGATAYHLINVAVGKPYPALMSLGVAVFCIVHVAVFIRRKVVDRKLMIALIGLAGAFTTWTLPIVFDGSSLTVALSLLALLFVWLGQKMASNAVANIGYIVYGIVFVRLIGIEIHSGFAVANETLSDYWSAFAQRIWTFGIGIGSIAAAFFLERRPVPGAPGLTPAEGNDIPDLAKGRIAAGFFFWVSLGLGFTLIQLEFNALFHHFAPFRLPILTVLWCALGGFLIWRFQGEDEGDGSSLVVGALCLIAMAVFGKFLIADLPSWGYSDLVFRGAYPNIHVLGRLLDFGSILCLLFLAWRFAPGGESSENLRRVSGVIAIALLFLYLNLELRSFLRAALPGFEAGGISILWALFAIGLVVPGILKGVRGLRLAGLAIFGCTVFKVFLSDLSGMDVVFRVIAAVVVGIVLLLGAFAYIHSSARFDQTETEPSE